MKSTKEDDNRDEQPQHKTNGDDLRRALNWIVIADIFAHVRLHGNVKWKPLALVRLAIVWVWSPQPGLVEAAQGALATVAKLFGSDAVAVRSYQALTTALVHYTPQLLPALWARLQRLMQQSGQAAWRVGKWLPLAVDGSRVTKSGSISQGNHAARRNRARTNAVGMPNAIARNSVRRVTMIPKLWGPKCG